MTEEEGEAGSAVTVKVACVRKRGIRGDKKDIRAESASSEALRAGARYLKVEEKAADIMTSGDTRGGVGGGPSPVD